MRIDVKFRGFELEAVATIELKDTRTKTFQFILNHNLTIHEIKCNNELVEWENIGEIKPTFRALSQSVRIVSERDIETLAIRYSGEIDGWHNCIAEKIRALSWYSVWYPQETSCDVGKDEVYIYDCEEYKVVKGNFNSNTGVWQYGGMGYDEFNIIAYKEEALKMVSNPYLNVYYVDDEIGQIAQSIDKIYLDILNFYNGNLFEKCTISQLDIACLSPIITAGGGYMRKDLMVCDNLRSDIRQTARLLGHEVAHTWCMGAECDSWEDWLNETTAEWSWILYALQAEDKRLFEECVKPKIEQEINLPAIKTADGSRPDGVHIKGVLLFYQVYKQYGKEVIQQIIQLFTKLPVKTTEKLLEEIKSHISLEVGNMIEEGITK